MGDYEEVISMGEKALENFWKELESALPPIFARHDVPKYCGTLITPGGLANLDSKGQGPSGKIRIGKYAGYERTAFIAWLRSRVR